jgi:hypothetical protein
MLDWAEWPSAAWEFTSISSRPVIGRVEECVLSASDAEMPQRAAKSRRMHNEYDHRRI